MSLISEEIIVIGGVMFATWLILRKMYFNGEENNPHVNAKK